MKKGTTSLSHMAKCDVIARAEKTFIKVNRSVLAMQNAILARLAFGTETMPADTSKPIELLDFDAAAVKVVLETLILRKSDPIKVPDGLESDVCSFC